MLHVEIYKGKGVQPWRIRPVAANGKVIMQSEGYLTKWNAKRAAKKMYPGVKLVLVDDLGIKVVISDGE